MVLDHAAAEFQRLTEDDGIRHGLTTLVVAAVSYDFGWWDFGLELNNMFDSDTDNSACYYETCLRDEPSGVEDAMFHPVDPAVGTGDRSDFLLGRIPLIWRRGSPWNRNFRAVK